jgi:hypothetical protein
VSSETLSSLALVITEASVTLHSAEEAQHRRHELSLRRRTLLGDDADSCSSTLGGAGKGEEGAARSSAEEEEVQREREACEHRVAEYSERVLKAQQQLAKKKQHLASACCCIMSCI